MAKTQKLSANQVAVLRTLAEPRPNYAMWAGRQRARAFWAGFDVLKRLGLAYSGLDSRNQSVRRLTDAGREALAALDAAPSK